MSRERSKMSRPLHHATTATDCYRSHQGAQATDTTYITTYQKSHCHTAPTSPEPEIMEFPIQRAELVPGEGNFVVGLGTRSRGPEYSSQKTDSYRGAMAWADKGAVCSPRSFKQPDHFVSSLRQYPCGMSAERSAEILERLVNYSRSRNQMSPVRSKVKSPPSPSQVSSDTKTLTGDHQGDQVVYTPRRDLDREPRTRRAEPSPPPRTEYEYDYLGRSSPYWNNLDVRLLTDILKNKPMLKLNGVDTQTQAAVTMVSKQTTTGPRRDPPRQQNVMPQAQTSSSLNLIHLTSIYSTAPQNHIEMRIRPNEHLLLSSSLSQISIKKNHIPSDKAEENNVVEQNKYPIHIMRGTRLCSSQQCLDGPNPTVNLFGNQVTEVWMVANQTCDLYQNRSVTRLIKNKVKIAPIDDTNSQHNIDCPEEVAVTLMHELITNCELIEENIKKGLLLKLCKKLKQILISKNIHIAQGSLKNEVVKLLSELPIKIKNHINKTEFINSLGDTMISKIEDLKLENWTKPDQKNSESNLDLDTKTPNISEKPDKNKILASRTKTYVVLQASDTRGSGNDTADLSIRAIDQADVDANLNRYADQINNEIDKWLSQSVHDSTSRQTMAKELTLNIIDALKSTELNVSLDTSTSEAEKNKFLSSKISTWLQKNFAQNKELLNRGAEILQIFCRVPMPMLSDPTKHPQQPTTSAQPHSSTMRPTLCQKSMSRTDCKLTCEKKGLDCNQCCSKGSNNNTADAASASVTCSKQDCPQNTSSPDVNRQTTTPMVACCKQDNSNNQESMNTQQVLITTMSDQSNFLQNTQPANLEVATPSAYNSQATNGNILHLQDNNIAAVEYVNNKFKSFFNNWLQSIPINATSPQEEELANMARQGIANAYMKALKALELNAEKLQNRFYYEDILADVLENLLNQLPQTQEMIQMKAVLKSKIIKQTITCYHYLYTIPGTVSYRLKLRQEMQNFIPETRKRAHLYFINGLFQLIVDNYIMHIGNKLLEDEDIAQVFLQNCGGLIEKACRVITAGHFDCNLESFRHGILEALRAVPIPRPAELMREVDLVNILRIVRNWSDNIRPHQTFDMEMSNHVHSNEEILGNQIYKLVRVTDFNDMAGMKALTTETIKFLEQVPLTDNIDIDKAVNHLQKMIKNRIIFMNLINAQPNDTLSHRGLLLHPPNDSLLDSEMSSLPGNLIQHHLRINTDIPHMPEHSVDMDEDYSQFAEGIPRSSSRERLMESNTNRTQFNRTRLSEIFEDSRQTDYGQHFASIEQQTPNTGRMVIGTPPSGFSVLQQTLPSHNSISQNQDMPQVVRRNQVSPNGNNYGGIHSTQVAGPSGIVRAMPRTETPRSGFSSLQQTLPSQNSPSHNQYINSRRTQARVPQNAELSPILNSSRSPQRYSPHQSERNNQVTVPMNDSFPDNSSLSRQRTPQLMRNQNRVPTNSGISSLLQPFSDNSALSRQHMPLLGSNQNRLQINSGISPLMATFSGNSTLPRQLTPEEYTPVSNQGTAQSFPPDNSSYLRRHAPEEYTPVRNQGTGRSLLPVNSALSRQYAPLFGVNQNRLQINSGISPVMETFSDNSTLPRQHTNEEYTPAEYTPVSNQGTARSFPPDNSSYLRRHAPVEYTPVRNQGTGRSLLPVNSALPRQCAPLFGVNQNRLQINSGISPVLETFSDNSTLPRQHSPAEDTPVEYTLGEYTQGTAQSFPPDNSSYLRRHAPEEYTPVRNQGTGRSFLPVNSALSRQYAPLFGVNQNRLQINSGISPVMETFSDNSTVPRQHTIEEYTPAEYTQGTAQSFPPDNSSYLRRHVPEEYTPVRNQGTGRSFLPVNSALSRQYAPLFGSNQNRLQINSGISSVMETFSDNSTLPRQHTPAEDTPVEYTFGEYTPVSNQGTARSFPPDDSTYLRRQALVRNQGTAQTSSPNNSTFLIRQHTPVSNQGTAQTSPPNNSTFLIRQHTPVSNQGTAQTFPPNNSTFLIRQHTPAEYTLGENTPVEYTPVSFQGAALSFPPDNSNVQSQYTPQSGRNRTVLIDAGFEALFGNLPRANIALPPLYSPQIPERHIPTPNVTPTSHNQSASHVSSPHRPPIVNDDGGLHTSQVAGSPGVGRSIPHAATPYSNFQQSMLNSSLPNQQYMDFASGLNRNKSIIPPHHSTLIEKYNLNQNNVTQDSYETSFLQPTPPHHSTSIKQYSPSTQNQGIPNALLQRSFSQSLSTKRHGGLHTSQIAGPSGTGRPSARGVPPYSSHGSTPRQLPPPMHPFLSQHIPHLPTCNQDRTQTPQLNSSPIEQSRGVSYRNISQREENTRAMESLAPNENNIIVPYRQDAKALGPFTYPNIRQSPNTNMMRGYPKSLFHGFTNGDYERHHYTDQDSEYLSDSRSEEEYYVKCRCLEKFNRVNSEMRDAHFYCDDCDCSFYFYLDACYC